MCSIFKIGRDLGRMTFCDGDVSRTNPAILVLVLPEAVLMV